MKFHAVQQREIGSKITNHPQEGAFQLKTRMFNFACSYFTLTSKKNQKMKTLNPYD